MAGIAAYIAVQQPAEIFSLPAVQNSVYQFHVRFCALPVCRCIGGRLLLADEFIIDLRDQIGAVFELCCFGEQVARHADKAVAVVHFYALIIVTLQSVFRQRAFDEDMYARTAHRAFGKGIGEQGKQFFGVGRENFARAFVHGVVYEVSTNKPSPTPMLSSVIPSSIASLSIF